MTHEKLHEYVYIKLPTIGGVYYPTPHMYIWGQFFKKQYSNNQTLKEIDHRKFTVFR